MLIDYWINYWKLQGRVSVGQHPQSRVLRTKRKQPIDKICWASTIEYIKTLLQVDSESIVLDLCSGNGLFSTEFAANGAKVISVDVSADLLADLDQLDHPSIETICQDIRKVQFHDNQFSHVFIYSGIQYFSPSETIILMKNCYRWLKPNGAMFLGDIPDAALRWEFYNTREKRSLYFDALSQGSDVIGTWYERDWILHLGEHVGFAEIELLNQPAEQIYAYFRYDVLLKK